MGVAHYFILLFFHIAALADSKHFRSDYNLRFSSVDGWFKMHVMPMTWSDAYLQCHNEGAVLASPENRHMLNAMKHIIIATKTSKPIFTGIHATYFNGVYHTVEGTPFSEVEKFINWAPDEPDNRNNSEDTLIMLPDGTMADVPSTNILPYICFLRGTHLVPTECGTIDPDYYLDPRTGSCYKFQNDHVVWSRAFSVCAGEGGYLAIVNSETEAQVLKELYTNHTGRGTDSSYANIGFRDFNKQGFSLTVHGQSVKEAGYNKWSGYQNIYNSIQNCGSINRNGMLVDTRCDGKTVFICEKNPDSLMSEGEKYITINNHE